MVGDNMRKAGVRRIEEKEDLQDELQIFYLSFKYVEGAADS